MLIATRIVHHVSGSLAVVLFAGVDAGSVSATASEAGDVSFKP